VVVGGDGDVTLHEEVKLRLKVHCTHHLVGCRGIG
jgi:hypothetical protein